MVTVGVETRWKENRTIEIGSSSSEVKESFFKKKESRQKGKISFICECTTFAAMDRRAFEHIFSHAETRTAAATNQTNI